MLTFQVQELYKHFQTAEQIIAMMDRPDSEKLLIQCSGIGPDKAGKIKKSWQSRNRGEQLPSGQLHLPLSD